MRSLYLLAAVCCLVLSAYASPIAHPEDDTDVKEVGRQSAAAPAAPAASSDDDDDDDDDDEDDDDDDLGALGGDDDDDDDDDDEEEDDDEGDDYLERFFDDILGGGEEDDEDDEPASAVVKPIVASVDTVAAAPAAAASSAEDVAPEGDEAVNEEGETAAAVEETEGVQKEPASAEVEAAASSEAAVETAAEAEEDDDDDDDIDSALDADDDDDDDEAEDDDDDDDDDDLSDALGRNIANKNSRALKEESTTKPSTVPAIYIVKYNRFVDNILEKMNDILRTSYDPVSVKLQPIDANKKTTKRKNTNKNKPKRKTSTKKKTSARGTVVTEKMKENPVTEMPEPVKEQNIQSNEIKPNEEIVEQTTENVPVESRANKDKSGTEKAKPTTIRTKPPTKATKPPTKVTKPPTKVTKPPTKLTKPKPLKTKTTTKKPSTNKNKTKPTEKSKPRAKGTLYGLSSLRRTGDVAVSIMANHTTVKSNFAVGPLILRVQKEVGRGAKKDIRSATATTAEMMGKLTLRVNNEGVASLHSIKVLQPKQVRVDSNNERTRELVWKRSSRIAHVVSEKLLSASKPMFIKE